MSQAPIDPDHLEKLMRKRSQCIYFLNWWINKKGDSEKWLRTIANLVGKLRDNKPCRLNDYPYEYDQAVISYQEFHTDVNGEELVFPSLEDATRHEIREIMEKAIRRENILEIYPEKNIESISSLECLIKSLTSDIETCAKAEAAARAQAEAVEAVVEA